MTNESTRATAAPEVCKFCDKSAALCKCFVHRRETPFLSVRVVSEDPVVEANRQLLLQRSQVGLKKYGTSLASARLSRVQLAQHALEESLDLANYLQAMIQTAQPSPSTGGELPEPQKMVDVWVSGRDGKLTRATLEADESYYTAEQMRAFRAEGEPATDSTGRVRKALEAALILCDTDAQRAYFQAEIEALAAREPAPVARDLAVEADPVKGIITGVREFYLGLLSRHLPSEAFDQARADDATTVAYRGVADRFLVLLESATAERAPARCIACGRLQGQPHAAGCKFAPFTIGRAH